MQLSPSGASQAAKKGSRLSQMTHVKCVQFWGHGKAHIQIKKLLKGEKFNIKSNFCQRKTRISSKFNPILALISI